MNSDDREALALHLWDEGIARPESFGLQIIDAILADGYRIEREPRTVTTVEELDALPHGSVAMRNGIPYTKIFDRGWTLGSTHYYTSASLLLNGPALVVHVPTK